MVSGPPTAIEGRMINRDDNPVQWALWLDELKEARAHIGSISSAPSAAMTNPDCGWAWAT